MDPITAGLNLAAAIVNLIGKIHDDASPAQRELVAGDITKTLHNCSAFLTGIQDKLNAAVGVGVK